MARPTVPHISSHVSEHSRRSNFSARFQRLDGPHHEDDHITSQTQDFQTVNSEDTPKVEPLSGEGQDAIMVDGKDFPNPGRLRWLKVRTFTLLPTAELEMRPYRHQYMFRRPRALQYYHRGEYIDSDGVRRRPEDIEELRMSKKNSKSEGRGKPNLVEGALSTQSTHEDDETDPEMEERTTDIIGIQRRRLDLFIDLVWVAIISNISDNFSTKAFSPGRSYGDALLEYIVPLLPAIRIWNLLREFLNTYYNGDQFQSFFIAWILMLALLFGNNILDFVEGHRKNLIISIYLVTRGSFAAVEAVYAYFMKEFRHNFYLSIALYMPSLGLWIGAIYVPWPTTAALLIPAASLETLAPVILESPLGSHILRHAARKALDTEHFVERLESFFLIIVGEGVFLLIKNSPLGFDITSKFGAGALALIIYSGLSWLYFNGDQSKEYIHAARLHKWGAQIFLYFHMLLYASFLLLDAGVLFLVQNSSTSPHANTGSSGDQPPSNVPASQIHHFIRTARWITSVNYALVLCFMTCIALLNRSLDKRGTLMVNSRYARLAPRGVAVVVVLLVNVKADMGPIPHLGCLMGCSWWLNIWEYWAGMERPGGVFEPKTEAEKLK